MHRGTIAEIDLGALADNLKAVKSLAGGLPVIAVVKADAYGHGAAEVSSALLKEGVHSLAVAFLEEAKALRESGIGSPIIVLFDCPDVKSFFDLKLTPVIHDLRSAKAFSKEAKKRGVRVDVHLKTDTGMGRMGFEKAGDLLEASGLPNLRVKGLMSHFSESDPSDLDFGREQLRRFVEIKKTLSKSGLRPLCHAANSAAIINFRESHLDAVRPGLALYGWQEGPFKPIMDIKATVVAVRKLKGGQPVSYGRTFITKRPTVSAVIAAGYADGYPRALSNSSHVILRGRRAPVMGRVCMDLIMADATGIEGVEAGCEAVILGEEGKESVSAWELARMASTVPYEILTSMGSRAKRTYKG